MSELTTLPTLSVVPNSISRPKTFVSDADSLFGEIPGLIAAWNTNIAAINLLAASLDQTLESANLAASAGAAASAVAAAAVAFKGQWAGLSGALHTPATAAHDGLVWMLLGNLENVAANEPGVSPQWLRITNAAAGMKVLATVTPAAGVTAVTVTNLAPSAMLMIVPKIVFGAGGFELSAVSTVRANLSVDNGTTFPGSEFSIASASTTPLFYVSHIHNAAMPGATKMHNVLGAAGGVGFGFQSASDITAGVVNAIQIKTDGGATFTGTGTLYIYGVN